MIASFQTFIFAFSCVHVCVYVRVCVRERESNASSHTHTYAHTYTHTQHIHIHILWNDVFVLFKLEHHQRITWRIHTWERSYHLNTDMCAWCVCVCVCVWIWEAKLVWCVRMYIFMCMYICTCIYRCMYVCIYVCMYVCTYVCMYVCMYVCVCVCVCVCILVSQHAHYLWQYAMLSEIQRKTSQLEMNSWWIERVVDEQLYVCMCVCGCVCVCMCVWERDGIINKNILTIRETTSHAHTHIHTHVIHTHITHTHHTRTYPQTISIRLVPSQSLVSSYHTCVHPFYWGPLFLHHTSHIIHHTSHITHYTSHITHHTSHITHHTPHIIPEGALKHKHNKWKWFFHNWYQSFDALSDKASIGAVYVYVCM